MGKSMGLEIDIEDRRACPLRSEMSGKDGKLKDLSNMGIRERQLKWIPL